MIDESGPYQPYRPYQLYPSGPSFRTATPSQATRDKAPPNSPFALRLARVLPSISALALLTVVWLPWTTLRVMYGATEFDTRFSGIDGLWLAFTAARQSRLAIVVMFLLWVVVPCIGLILGQIILRRTRISLILISIYGGWLLLTTGMSLLSLYGALTAPAYVACDSNCTSASRTIEWGVWLAFAALALGWAAFALLLRYRSQSANVYPGIAERYTTFHRMGAAIFTLGAALWAFGFFAVPWATAGCSGLHISFNHFVRGACRGLDGYDVLTTGLGPNDSVVWPFMAASLLLGLLVIVTVWLPRMSLATWVTALGWSLLVTLMAIIGVYGVRMTMANPPIFAFGEQLIWVPSYGVALSALGLLTCCAAVALLARDEIRHAR